MILRRAARLLIPPVCLLAWALSLVACDDLEQRVVHRPPGERLYRKLCADCHGIDGRGNTPKGIGNAYCDLTDDSWKTSGDAITMAIMIRKGEFGEMPAHPELTDEQVKQIVDHILKLRRESRGSS